ncbi:MAG: four helix bundle protein [bacterium]|nr:four helix bundle protein [bacterium]
MEKPKIKSFTDLLAWQKGHEFALLIYALTDKFPQKEIYASTSQMRRASVSITSNIAEGFSRNSYKEKIQFYYMSLGSTTELHNQLILSKDLKYINEKEFASALDIVILINKLLNGLIKSLKILI